MSEGLIYYAHYGFSHLRLRGSRTRKQILSGRETRQLKCARANVIRGGPGGNSERRSIKVQAVPIVTVADIRHHCRVCTSEGEIFYERPGPELFLTRISGDRGTKMASMRLAGPADSAVFNQASLRLRLSRVCIQKHTLCGVFFLCFFTVLL